MAVSSGGVVSKTAVDSGGSMLLYYSGRANSVTLNEGSSVTVFRSAAASDVLLNGGQITASSGAYIYGADVKSGAELYLTNYASAANVTISSGGILKGFILQDAETSFSTLSGFSMSATWPCRVWIRFQRHERKQC